MDKASKPGSAGAGPTARIVALTGFMGSGKTTVGQQLAELLGWEFVDLDAVIEQREKTAIREIFARRGEAEFRRIEHLALRELVAECEQPTVVALGGGTFLQPENEMALQSAGVRTVFLEVPVEEMFARCATGEAEENLRPLARDAENFRRLYEARLRGYRKANLIVDAAGKTPEEIAVEIATWLQR